VNATPLSWIQIIRLGLVQTALGAIVVLTTSTLNRIMVVELALPAMLPGGLVALHYALQVLRPRLGHGSDSDGRHTLWIVGGMTILALGGIGAAVATAWMGTHFWAGIALAVLSFCLIGAGVGACGTTLLVLLAKRVDERRRGAAATVVWVMMITGFVATTAIAGILLDPYSPFRLIAVASAVSVFALVLSLLAIRNIEGPTGVHSSNERVGGEEHVVSFATAFAQVWTEPRARRFAVFVFVSMIAYSAPELILEPFAGSVFGFTPGESTALASVLHGGVLIGMGLVAIATSLSRGQKTESMQLWTTAGCLASGGALLVVAATGLAAPALPLRPAVFLLGVANGVYAVAAIGSMMSLAGSGHKSREGVRLGLWGAAQAIAFGLGGFVGTLAYDLTRAVIGSASSTYSIVFAAEAMLFLASAALVVRVYDNDERATSVGLTSIVRLSVSDAGGAGHEHAARKL
jgi:MFS transporter, BCD family, chlorophyll transporter